MNRAVAVLVECIPSPLDFSHPVHLTFLTLADRLSSKKRAIFAKHATYKPYALLARRANPEKVTFVKMPNFGGFASTVEDIGQYRLIWGCS